MQTAPPHKLFGREQIETLNKAVSMAEELVSNHFKMSASQWLHPKYDVKTMADLAPEEIVHGPFAQIIRYEGKRKGSELGSGSYDFYKICLQDHAILCVLDNHKHLALLPFCLYVVTHELVHIVRFSKFLQSFKATSEEKIKEERRVHALTHKILKSIPTPGLDQVIQYFHEWHRPLEDLDNRKLDQV